MSTLPLPVVVLSRLRARFPCTDKYESHVNQVIDEYINKGWLLDRFTMPMVMRGIYDKLRTEEIPFVKFMFKALFVHLLSAHQQATHPSKPQQSSMMMDLFLNDYRQFKTIDESEQELLLEFRTFLRVVLQLFYPNDGKQELVALAGRMCQVTYDAKGRKGAAEMYRRRLCIFEREAALVVIGGPPESLRVEESPPLPFPLPPPAGKRLKLNIDSITDTYIPPLSVVTKLVVPCPLFPSLVSSLLPVPPPHAVSPTTLSEKGENADESVAVTHLPPSAPTEYVTSSRAFWLSRSVLMEAGEDIPYLTVPAHLAQSSYAYPTHDLRAVRYYCAPHVLTSAASVPSVDRDCGWAGAPCHVNIIPLQKKRHNSICDFS